MAPQCAHLLMRDITDRSAPVLAIRSSYVRGGSFIFGIRYQSPLNFAHRCSMRLPVSSSPETCVPVCTHVGQTQE